MDRQAGKIRSLEGLRDPMPRALNAVRLLSRLVGTLNTTPRWAMGKAASAICGQRAHNACSSGQPADANSLSELSRLYDMSDYLNPQCITVCSTYKTSVRIYGIFKSMLCYIVTSPRSL